MKIVALVRNMYNGNKQDLCQHAIDILYLGAEQNPNHHEFWAHHFDVWFDQGLNPKGVMEPKRDCTVPVERKNLTDREYVARCKELERIDHFERFAFWCGRLVRGV